MYTIKAKSHDLTDEMSPENIINSSNALSEAMGLVEEVQEGKSRDRSLFNHPSWSFRG
jgi:hypothetical protein